MKCLEIEDFVRLMLVRLAHDSQIIDLCNPNIKYACIPNDYKQRIAYILTANNGWKEEFSSIIDIDHYFKNHFEWEEQMSNALANELSVMGRKYEYDFMKDGIRIIYDENDIIELMACYSIRELIDTMDHFVSLLGSHYFSKEYLEKNPDYYEKIIKNMCNAFDTYSPKSDNSCLALLK